MSKIIIPLPSAGPTRSLTSADAKLKEALDKYGENQEIGFPNTAYYLPIIYSIMGTKIEKLKDAVPVMKLCQALLPPVPSEKQSPALPGTRPGRRHGHLLRRRNLRGDPLSGRPQFLRRR